MTAGTTASQRPRIAFPRTMKAMVQEKYGPASDVLELKEVATPEIEADEVLVKVSSSSINAREWHLMTGKPYVFRAVFGFSPKTPTLGADVSGVVVAAGPEVTRFKVEDEVFGDIGVGAYAEYARAKENHLAIKPGQVTFQDTAAVPTAGLTALQGLRDVAMVEPGQRVLINGASGGVGTYAVQIAKVFGAELTAVTSTRNVDQTHELGADRVVDYTRENIVAGDERYDVLFDGPGNHSLVDCRRLLAPGGTYIMVGGPKHDWTGPLFRMIRGNLVFAFGNRSHRLVNETSNADDLTTLGEMLSSGQIRSMVEDSYPLAEVGPALDRQGQFHARGKTVVTVEGAL